MNATVNTAITQPFRAASEIRIAAGGLSFLNLAITARNFSPPPSAAKTTTRTTMTNSLQDPGRGKADDDDDDDGSIVGDDDPRPSCAICWRAFNQTDRKQETPCTDAACRRAKSFCTECVLTYRKTFHHDKKNAGKPFLCPNCRTGVWGPPGRQRSYSHHSGIRIAGVRRPSSSPISPRTQRRRSDHQNLQYRGPVSPAARGPGVGGIPNATGQPFAYGSYRDAHFINSPQQIPLNHTHNQADELFPQVPSLNPGYAARYYPVDGYYPLGQSVHGHGLPGPRGSRMPPLHPGGEAPMPFARLAALEQQAARNRDFARLQHQQIPRQPQMPSQPSQNGFGGVESTAQHLMPMRMQFGQQQMAPQPQDLPITYRPLSSGYSMPISPYMPLNQPLHARADMAEPQAQIATPFGPMQVGDSARTGDQFGTGFGRPMAFGNATSAFSTADPSSPLQVFHNGPMAVGPPMEYEGPGRYTFQRRNAISYTPSSYLRGHPESPPAAPLQAQPRTLSFEAPNAWQGPALNRTDHDDDDDDDEDDEDEDEEDIWTSTFGDRPPPHAGLANHHNYAFGSVDNDDVFANERGDDRGGGNDGSRGDGRESKRARLR